MWLPPLSVCSVNARCFSNCIRKRPKAIFNDNPWLWCWNSPNSPPWTYFHPSSPLHSHLTGLQNDTLGSWSGLSQSICGPTDLGDTSLAGDFLQETLFCVLSGSLSTWTSVPHYTLHHTAGYFHITGHRKYWEENFDFTVTNVYLLNFKAYD